MNDTMDEMEDDATDKVTDEP